MLTREPVYDLAGGLVPQPCMVLKLGDNGKPVVQPLGERLCCHRTDGHFPRWPHTDRDDAGNLVEWR